MATRTAGSTEDDYDRFVENFLTNYGDAIETEEDYDKAFQQYMTSGLTYAQKTKMKRKVLENIKKKKNIVVKEKPVRKEKYSRTGRIKGQQTKTRQTIHYSKRNKKPIQVLRDVKGRFTGSNRDNKNVQ